MPTDNYIFIPRDAGLSVELDAAQISKVRFTDDPAQALRLEEAKLRYGINATTHLCEFGNRSGVLVRGGGAAREVANMLGRDANLISHPADRHIVVDFREAARGKRRSPALITGSVPHYSMAA